MLNVQYDANDLGKDSVRCVNIAIRIYLLRCSRNVTSLQCVDRSKYAERHLKVHRSVRSLGNVSTSVYHWQHPQHKGSQKTCKKKN